MRASKKRLLLGFGFDPLESAHHFVLVLEPGEGAGGAAIEERFTYGETVENRRPERRASLDDYTWNRVASEVQAHFNRRLSDTKRSTSAFGPGENLLAPYVGKELTLLFWALDGIDPTDLPNALANWLGFVPEERWWLYTTVKASGAGPDERDRGWRKAIRLAFAENPAPPPADAGRGLLEEPMPLQTAETSRSHENGAALDDDHLARHERKSEDQTLSLFE